MQRVIFLMFLILMMTSSAKAEDGHHLRIPDVDEYLRALPQIFDLANSSIDLEYGPPFFDGIMFSTLLNEVQWRFTDLSDVDAHLLYETFHYLVNETGIWIIDRDFWGEAIIIALLKQFEGDLNEETTLNSVDWEMIITPRDFSGNGRDELMVEFRSDFYTQHLVVQQDATGYRIVNTSLPWFGCCFSYWDYRSGFMSELLFEDMTGDGQPEWVLALGGVGGGHQNHGHLYILTWEDNQLINLAPPHNIWEARARVMAYSAAGGGGAPLFPNDVVVDFEDTDDDGRIEVIITQQYQDNWGCQPTETRLFAWDADVEHFELSEHLWDYPDTAQCGLRLAQDAMWDEDYEAAVPLLEHSLALYAEEDFVDTRAVYAGVRLALAYAFTGRSEEAATLLDTINPYDALMPIDELVIKARSTFNQQMSAFDLCLSMYDTFDRYFRSDWLTDTYWGVTHNIVVPLVSAGAPGANVRAAGCPAPELLDTLLAEPLVTHISPIEQLASRGISVAHSGTTDLDGDDVDDWLIVLDANIPPILLLSTSSENYYHLSRVNIQNPQRFEILIPWQLPDSAPALLGYFYDDTTLTHQRGHSLWEQVPSCPGTDIEGALGGIILITLEGNQSASVQELPLCEPWELDMIFPEGEGSPVVEAWTADFNEDRRVYEPYQPVTLYWDAEQRRYVLSDAVTPPTEITETSFEEQNEGTVSSLDPQRYFYDQIVTTFEEGHYADVLDAIDVLIRADIDDSFLDAPLHYYRALALEALGRNDEALTEYIAIYEAAPESAWGMLAALHLEVIDGG